MKQLSHVILFTFIELAHQRIYQIIATILIIAPWLLLIPASLFMLDIGKVFADFLFMFMHLWLLIYIFFLVTPLVNKDIEQSICQMFLTLPMSRSIYLWGRYTGVLLGIAPLLLAYDTSSALAFQFAQTSWLDYVPAGLEINFLLGTLLILLPYLALTSVLFLIASRATGLPETTVFLFCVWLLCWSLPPVLAAMNQTEVAQNTPVWIGELLALVNQLLPDLSSSTISLYLAHMQDIDSLALAAYCAQHLGYAMLAMLIAVRLFRDRDLS